MFIYIHDWSIHGTAVACSMIAWPKCTQYRGVVCDNVKVPKIDRGR